MAAATHYDAIIIGAGQGGSPLSTALARAGRRTALIERDQIGGTCINYGCTPTKTMVASARVAWLARRGADYGVQTGTIAVDQPVVRERKRKIVESFRAGSEKRIESAKGLDLIRGSATFTGPRSLRVACDGDSEQELTADLIFIDTGTRNATPKIDGLADVPHLDSTSIMELDETPEHLIVLGGGYIGLEFAQMFRRFGSAVTVIQRGSHLLAREDDDIADAMRQILEEDGIDVRLNAEASRVRAANGGVEVTVNRRAGDQRLSSAGRDRPRAEYRRPEPGRGRRRDQREGLRQRQRAAGNERARHLRARRCQRWAAVHPHLVRRLPCHPRQPARGRQPHDARPPGALLRLHRSRARPGRADRAAGPRAGTTVRVAKMPMSSVARAREMDETRGLMKVLVDRKTDQILGGAILGVWGGEIMTQLQLAMMGKLTCRDLSDAVFAHPTLGESLNNLLSSLS